MNYKTDHPAEMSKMWVKTTHFFSITLFFEIMVHSFHRTKANVNEAENRKKSIDDDYNPFEHRNLKHPNS